MQLPVLDRLILGAQKPSRYAGGELNAVHKRLDRVALKWALAFPDTYEVGMSNVGFRLLYHALNERPEIACERFFMPWPDMESALRAERLPLFSIESRAPLRAFDVLGFTLQFELCYTTVLAMLELGGVPLATSDRGRDDPLVLGGGPCAYNPEPVADFFDALVVGEGEEAIHEISDVVLDWKRSRGSRQDLLWHLAEVPGVYVPSLFRPRYGPDRTLAALEPLKPGYETVVRRVIPDLNLVPQAEKPIVPFMQAVHDRLPLLPGGDDHAAHAAARSQPGEAHCRGGPGSDGLRGGRLPQPLRRRLFLHQRRPGGFLRRVRSGERGHLVAQPAHRDDERPPRRADRARAQERLHRRAGSGDRAHAPRDQQGLRGGPAAREEAAAARRDQRGRLHLLPQAVHALPVGPDDPAGGDAAEARPVARRSAQARARLPRPSREAARRAPRSAGRRAGAGRPPPRHRRAARVPGRPAARRLDRALPAGGLARRVRAGPGGARRGPRILRAPREGQGRGAALRPHRLRGHQAVPLEGARRFVEGRGDPRLRLRRRAMHGLRRLRLRGGGHHRLPPGGLPAAAPSSGAAAA